MLNWILNSIIYNKDELNTTEYSNKIKKSKDEKKRAVRIIENFYLYYKKKLELKIKRAERRKLYRILNRTNPPLIQYFKYQNSCSINTFKKKNNFNKYLF